MNKKTSAAAGRMPVQLQEIPFTKEDLAAFAEIWAGIELLDMLMREQNKGLVHVDFGLWLPFLVNAINRSAIDFQAELSERFEGRGKGAVR